MTTLVAKDISKSFSKISILKGISLTASAGETIAIMGKSGEGKSTLLHILGTLDEPTSGCIEICGKTPKNDSVATLRNQHIGFIFQSYHLLEDFSVIDNVTIPLKIGRKASDGYARALALLEAVGLKGKEKQLAKLLSGGEKQRVAIARALVNQPDLLLADEPTGNLDRDNSKQIQELLLNLAKSTNTTLIVVTHDEDFARQCDHLLFLKGGQIYNPQE